jgi:predicted nuclease of predicted toxin-antitoxin system
MDDGGHRNDSQILYGLSFNQSLDLDIYNTAKEYGQVILISKDSDFSELISRLGSPPKLINLKIGNCDNRTLWSILQPKILEAVNLLTQSDLQIVDFE